MIKLGDYNTLRVVKSVDFGLYLDGGDEGEILLPTRYVPEGTKVGDDIPPHLSPLPKLVNSLGWNVHGQMNTVPS